MAFMQKQLDLQLKSIKTNTTKLEIEIVKYKNNKIDADQLEQEFTEMCERLQGFADRFEKEYKDYPKDILKLMNATDNAIAMAQVSIDIALKK